MVLMKKNQKTVTSVKDFTVINGMAMIDLKSVKYCGKLTEKN